MLEDFDRVPLCHRPTPLEPLDRLTAHLGGPRLWIKRDDCTGLAIGGNKTRKLEFLLADARRAGADTLITVGAVQSNHARQTAAAAARCGMHCELVLTEVVDRHEPEYTAGGNVLLDGLLGAQVHCVRDAEAAAACVGEVADRAAHEGRTAYFIPAGGSSPVGALGYVDAAGELVEQARQMPLGVDHIVVAAGSCGTLAGILVGLAAVGSSPAVTGIAIYQDFEATAASCQALIVETARLVESGDGAAEHVHVLDDYLGGGYGVPTPGMIEAVELSARLEGVLLDPVYTGKAMAGLIDLVRQGSFAVGQNVVFWHTGGTPALFAYRSAFASD